MRLSWMRLKQYWSFPKRLLPPMARQRGMSLIEIIIVISLIGVIMSVIIVNLTNSQDQAMRDAAKLGMGNVAQSLQHYRVHNFRFPAADQGLRALVQNPGNAPKWRGPYIEEAKLKDPWGNDYTYESDGRNFKIVSPGPDGNLGTEDDVTYPEDDKPQE